MIDPACPTYIPIVLPADESALRDSPRWDGLLVSASYAVRAGTRNLCALARQRCSTLLVDPKTASYQYEGYMAAEDLRGVPYSPGRTTLGTLWQPRDYATRESRGALIDEVFALQRTLQADLLLAPYFLVSQADHPWLGLAAEIGAEALRRGDELPVGVVVCVEIDALLGPGSLDTVTDAFATLRPALWLLNVVNHDELEASPEEMEVVLALIDRLGAAGAPVVHAYAGRGGLVATAAGAAGYAAGALELETHPKRYFREGLINLHSNSFYLPRAMIRLPVRLAEAVRRARPEAAGNTDKHLPITRMLARERVRAALAAKRAEMAALAALPEAARGGHLVEAFDAGLDICTRAQASLATQGGAEQLGNGDFHYLEVMRQLVGGPPATLPDIAGI